MVTILEGWGGFGFEASLQREKDDMLLERRPCACFCVDLVVNTPL